MMRPSSRRAITIATGMVSSTVASSASRSRIVSSARRRSVMSVRVMTKPPKLVGRYEAL